MKYKKVEMPARDKTDHTIQTMAIRDFPAVGLNSSSPLFLKNRTVIKAASRNSHR